MESNVTPESPKKSGDKKYKICKIGGNTRGFGHPADVEEQIITVKSGDSPPPGAVEVE